MQLAVITDEIDSDLDRALGVMAEYGVRNAELRALWDTHIAELTDAQVRQVQGILAQHQARVVSIASPVCKTHLPGQAAPESADGATHGASDVPFDHQAALLERCIDIAQQLDAPLIRTFTFWKRGLLTPQVEDRIVDAYFELARIAENAGVTLVVENEHACYTGTGAQTARIVERIASPAVKIVWDPGNALMAGEIPLPSGYEAVRPHLAHVHVKDAKLGADGKLEWCVVGEGEVGWAEQIRLLREDGYAGYLSLETHYRGVDGDQEQASRECLKALLDVV